MLLFVVQQIARKFISLHILNIIEHKNMKHLYAILLAVAVISTASAQVTVSGTTSAVEPTFNDQVKTDNVKAEFQSEAKRKAERAAIRKERNTIEFNAGISGSLSNFNSKWQQVNGNSNSITAIANILFTHSFKKDLFSIDNKVTGKIGATSKNKEWTKSQDEWFISTSPAYKMTNDWNLGAIISLRSQFANGFNSENNRTSRFFSPAYLNVSVGFTYVCPKKKFPIKINLSPISMSSTYVTSSAVKDFFFNDKFGFSRADYIAGTQTLTDAQRNTPYVYGLTLANGSSRYEGGSSVQIDFDRTFGKKEIFRYRTTLYSFYGWINEIAQQTGANRALDFEHIAPTVRWEHTIDIKATKYFSTQFYFQMYYNKAQCKSLQTQIVLGVGVSYTFKNK
jgi:hypothetical protein